MFLSNLLSPKDSGKPLPLNEALFEENDDNQILQVAQTDQTTPLRDEEDASSLWSSESGSSTNIRYQIENENRKKRLADQMRMSPRPNQLDVDDFDHGDVQEPPNEEEEMK